MVTSGPAIELPPTPGYLHSTGMPTLNQKSAVDSIASLRASNADKDERLDSGHDWYECVRSSYAAKRDPRGCK